MLSRALAGRRRAIACSTASGLCLALAVAGCGSSSSKSSSSAAAATTSHASQGSGTQATAYHGGEATLPHSWPSPTKKAYSFKIGWLIPDGAIPSLQELTTGIKREVSSLGGQVVVLDSQLNPQTEVNNFNQLLAQHVSGIISFPLDPKSLAPSLAQAKAKHIPVVAIDAPPSAGSALIPGYSADILLSRDLGAFTVAATAAKAHPGGSFALLGIAQPIPTLQYQIAQDKKYATADGLKFVGETDAQADSNTAAATAMSAILAKHRSVNFVFTYNDVSGVGAAAQAITNGDSTVKVISFNGEDEALQAVKAGRLFGTYDVPYVENGSQAVIALYDTLTKQHLPLAPQISAPGHIVLR